MAHGQITTLQLLLLLLLLSATQPSLAQQSNGTSKHTSSGQRALVAFSCIAFLVLVILLSVCQRRGARPQPSTRRGTGAAPVHAVLSGRRRPRVGVGRDLVEAFPTAVYGDVKSKSGPLECAVCLAEFADSEELRVLPPCCHVFHPACIDPWLAAAVTCPLCRADLTSESSDMAGRQEVAVSVQGELHKEDCEFSLSVSAVRMHELTAAAPVHQHTLRLPEHVMKELAALRSNRRGQRTTSERT